MFSNMLIEALLLNKKVYRVQIDYKVDLFKFDLITSNPINTRRKLYNQLKKKYYADSNVNG